MIYFDETYLQVIYEGDVPCVHMSWKTFSTSEEMRAGLEKGLELVREKNASKWLADVRQMGIISEEDQKWSNEDWFPRALAAGIKYMAVIVSEDIFNKMSVEEIMNNVPGTDLTSHYFNSIEDAREWLSKQ